MSTSDRSINSRHIKSPRLHSAWKLKLNKIRSLGRKPTNNSGHLLPGPTPTSASLRKKWGSNQVVIKKETTSQPRLHCQLPSGNHLPTHTNDGISSASTTSVGKLEGQKTISNGKGWILGSTTEVLLLQDGADYLVERRMSILGIALQGFSA